MLLYFDPDFRTLPLGDASEGIARLLFGVVEELCQQQAEPVQRVRLAPSGPAKLLGMFSQALHGDLRLACPTLQHFARPDDRPPWSPTRRVVTGIHTLVPWLQCRYGPHLRNRPVAAFVQNIEHKLRKTRPTQRLKGPVRNLIESWNIAGLEQLDRSLAGCDLLFLSSADHHYFESEAIACRSRRFVGYCTILPDTVLAGYQARLDRPETCHPRLLFVANGANQDNRTALKHFLSHLTNPAMPTELTVCGGGWQLFDPGGTPPNLKLIFLGYLPDLSSVLAPGAVGLNLDLAGSGIKTKAMDYLAMGLPFVSSPAAVQGMPSAIHQSLPVHEAPEDLLREAQALMRKSRWLIERTRLLQTVSNWATRQQFRNRVAAALSSESSAC